MLKLDIFGSLINHTQISHSFPYKFAQASLKIKQVNFMSLILFFEIITLPTQQQLICYFLSLIIVFV